MYLPGKAEILECRENRRNVRKKLIGGIKGCDVCIVSKPSGEDAGGILRCQDMGGNVRT